MAKRVDNNAALRKIWTATGLTQEEALLLFNKGQIRPLKLSTFMAYQAAPGVARRRECPDEILAHAKKMFGTVKKGS